MATVPTKKVTLAATGTALLAFLLIVPTILVASGVFGQGTGAGTGYTVFVNTPTSGPSFSVTQGVGNLAPGQAATLNFDQPSSAPLETASVISDSVVNNLISSPSALTAALSDPAQLHQLATAPAALQTLLADRATRDAIMGNAEAMNAILGSGLGATAALQNTDFQAALVTQMSTNPALVATVSSNPASLTTLLQNAEAATTIINSVVNNPTVLNAMSQNTAAVGALLQNEQARAAINSNPQVLNQILANVLDDRHVGSVNIVAGQSGQNVQMTVNEYLPTDSHQSAVTSSAGASLSHIQLQVATPGSGGATTFNAMKILEITSSLPAGGVQKATVTFKVTQAELTLMGKQASDIGLLHQVNGQWVPLPTTLVGGPDANGVYTFSAETPSFSYFAIAAAQPVQSTSAGFAGLGIALLILGVLAVIAIAVVVVMKKKQQ